VRWLTEERAMWCRRLKKDSQSLLDSTLRSISRYHERIRLMTERIKAVVHTFPHISLPEFHTPTDPINSFLTQLQHQPTSPASSPIGPDTIPQDHTILTQQRFDVCSNGRGERVRRITLDRLSILSDQELCKVPRDVRSTHRRIQLPRLSHRGKNNISGVGAGARQVGKQRVSVGTVDVGRRKERKGRDVAVARVDILESAEDHVLVDRVKDRGRVLVERVGRHSNDLKAVTTVL